MTWYEPKTSVPPEGATAGAQSDVPDALALLPWMPLDGLIEQWASFGATAFEVEGLQAASAAFVALAQEREAMQTASYQLTLRRLPNLPVERLRRCQQQQPIISLLGQAASSWYEVASALLQILEAPSQRETERLSLGLSLRALLSAALTQRARVWDLAHRLLHAQAQAASMEQELPTSEEEAQP